MIVNKLPATSPPRITSMAGNLIFTIVITMLNFTQVAGTAVGGAAVGTGAGSFVRSSNESTLLPTPMRSPE